MLKIFRGYLFLKFIFAKYCTNTAPHFLCTAAFLSSLHFQSNETDLTDPIQWNRLNCSFREILCLHCMTALIFKEGGKGKKIPKILINFSCPEVLIKDLEEIIEIVQKITSCCQSSYWFISSYWWLQLNAFHSLQIESTSK